MKTTNRQIARYIKTGNRLRQLRAHLTQSEFAEKIKLPLRTYIYYESGERMPKGDVIYRIASICDVSTDWILGGDKTDCPQGTAILALSENKYPDRHCQPGQPFPDNCNQAPGDSHPVLAEDCVPDKGVERRPEPAAGGEFDPAMPSVSPAAMERMRRIQKLYAHLQRPIHPIDRLLERRNPIVTRLYHLWTAIVIIPARIRYIFRHTLLGSLFPPGQTGKQYFMVSGKSSKKAKTE